MLNDVGKFVGRYLQVLACVAIASMIIEAIFFDRLFVDFSVIFLFWAAAYLIKHHPTAHKWTIGVCGYILACFVAALIYTVIAGTPEAVVLLGRRIERPLLWHFAAMDGALAVLVALPLVLLL